MTAQHKPGRWQCRLTPFQHVERLAVAIPFKRFHGTRPDNYDTAMYQLQVYSLICKHKFSVIIIIHRRVHLMTL